MKNLRVLFIPTIFLLTACARVEESTGSGPGLTIQTVPTSAAYVSGGETLVRIEAPADVDLADLTVSVNGTDATAAFRPAPADWLGRQRDALLGLVTGLRNGDNEVIASLPGREAARLTITNYRITGPIFSGARLEPYLCLAELAPSSAGEPRRFPIGNGQFIEGAALDGDCTYPTRVDYVYRTDGGEEWLPLENASALPADVARVTTTTGASVPFVVRIETGTINRAIYQTAILTDPTAPEPTPWVPPAGWNGRLIYTFGGGCEAGFFQGTSTGGVLRETMLSKGYAVASSTLNVNAQGGCNDPLSAETAMMVKERFAEAYGPPVYTIGNGGSGGAMQQLLIAGAYPGILDGILPTLTFPDAVSYLIDSVECYPIREHLNDEGIEDEEKRLIGGWALWQTCDRSLGNRPNRASPYDCPDVIPVEVQYHAARNPGGIRCSVYDAMRSVFGTRPGYPEIVTAGDAAFARSPHDNVGVQYGLAALREGLISKERFLAVNERIGGWDIDFVRTTQRTQGDPGAIRAAYETGRITNGTGGLAATPIIDERSYLDDIGDFHTSYYSFVMRERLVRDLGHADHYVLQRHGRGMSLADVNLAAMDEWLANLARDTSAAPLLDRIVRARPGSLADACWDAEGSRIVEAQTYDEESLFDNRAGRCNALYPPHTGPRMVAGGPLTNDLLKCELKPLDRAEYPVQFTDAEWARLRPVFPGGVCDWSKPGVGQVAQVGTWLSFGPSRVNRYTPPAR
ncbi:MAG TPA: DUF6351 family protein [Longimicrobiaceae bacterium]|nr:DUF6351 family protein [Longimicrobiaceae bacterium]